MQGGRRRISGVGLQLVRVVTKSKWLTNLRFRHDRQAEPRWRTVWDISSSSRSTSRLSTEAAAANARACEPRLGKRFLVVFGCCMLDYPNELIEWALAE